MFPSCHIDVSRLSGIGLEDLTVQVQDRRFRVHKAVLVMVSDYFTALISEYPTLGSMVLPNLSASEFEWFINYVYGRTDRTKDPDIPLVRTIEILHYFDMISAKFLRELNNSIYATVSDIPQLCDILRTYSSLSLYDGVGAVLAILSDRTSSVGGARKLQLVDTDRSIIRRLLEYEDSRFYDDDFTLEIRWMQRLNRIEHIPGSYEFLS